MKTLRWLLVAFLCTVPPLLRAADGGDIKGLRIAPASTPVFVVGTARLTVEPMERGEGGLQAPYRVEVQNLPADGEHGQFSLTFTEADFTKLANGQSLNFGGEAVSVDGNKSSVRGTVTPSSNDGGEVKIKVIGKRGMLVFKTTYQLSR